jgi:hypothetical protein
MNCLAGVSEGTNLLLSRLRAGEKVPFPKGLTEETLRKYLQVAEDYIAKGKDYTGIQGLRRDALLLLLNLRF